MSGLSRHLGVFVLGAAATCQASAQHIDWSSTRFSGTVQWIVPQKEFGTYWNDGPAVGLFADIPMEGPFSPVAMGIFSWHSAAESPRKSLIPPVLLFQLGGGVTWTHGLSPTVDVTLGAMLVNNAFILTGPAVRPGFDNEVESEFGFSSSATLTINTGSLPPFSFLVSYQPILVGLEPVAIASFGLVMRISGE